MVTKRKQRSKFLMLASRKIDDQFNSSPNEEEAARKQLLRKISS
jgi:hypothetical protein